MDGTQKGYNENHIQIVSGRPLKVSFVVTVAFFMGLEAHLRRPVGRLQAPHTMEDREPIGRQR